jgi:hypothetical protein
MRDPHLLCHVHLLVHAMREPDKAPQPRQHHPRRSQLVSVEFEVQRHSNDSHVKHLHVVVEEVRTLPDEQQQQL